MDRIKHIRPSDKTAYSAAKERWDSIAKPLGSFGMFEDAICRIAAVQGTADVDISSRTAVIMCGDHGVVCEGVTQCGQEVTAECAAAIAEGRSNINALARTFSTDVIAVDVGIASDVKCEKLLNRKVIYGTQDIAQGSAMTPEQTKKAVTVGIDIVKQLSEKGVKLIITGEMGIGNTTSSAAIASVLLNVPPEKVTGRGAGLSGEGLARKINAVRRAIEVNRPDAEDHFQVLQKLGGAEI
ncbi:MAG: nicotinate-nucleotide--dimethylbenzimidazole phosphoribosyltransferase, partial [Ruminococcus sp.]|nr:nicotinate-nucleotide--dimethylbenzimidazole phosphoribosyltransferase [Ruminococcus sp.]